MSTIEDLDKKSCCGCSSCCQKCPKGAISMIENKEGFLYPTIDKEKCINCGICSKVCPQLKKLKDSIKDYPKAYALRNKNTDELSESSSGGFFTLIANYVIEMKGVVFGAAFDSNLKVNHIKATSKEQLKLLRGSKYVQSNINQTYREVEDYLKKDKYVLFTGTPCQVAGLNAYLMKDYDKLITADIVCHGVPSQKLFQKYLEYLSSKYKSKVIEYSFRNKEKDGWGLTGKIKTADGKTRYINPDFDPYYSNFLNGTTYRESCYQCKYTNYNRPADFTMADFWGIQYIHPEFFKELGNSLILVNNKKALNIFEELSQYIDYVETDIDKAAAHNGNLVKPCERVQERDNIYNGIDEKDSVKYIKKNLKYKITIKKIVKKFLPKKLKEKIKRIIKKS